MPKRSRASAARSISRQTLYLYLLFLAGPVFVLGLYLTPNHKRMREWDAADGRYVAGYYLTVVGSILGSAALLALLLDQQGGGVPERRRGSKGGGDKAEG